MVVLSRWRHKPQRHTVKEGTVTRPCRRGVVPGHGERSRESVRVPTTVTEPPRAGTLGVKWREKVETCEEKEGEGDRGRNGEKENTLSVGTYPEGGGDLSTLSGRNGVGWGK